MKVTTMMEQRHGIPQNGNHYNIIVTSILILCFSGLSSYLYKLDERNKKKLGKNLSRVIQRTYGSPRDGPPPKKLPL